MHNRKNTISRNRFIVAVACSVWLAPMSVSVQPVFGAQPQQSQTRVAPVIHRNVQADRVTNPRFNGAFDRATSGTVSAARSFQSLPANEHLYFVEQQINELPSKDVPTTANEPASALAMPHDGSMFMMAPKEADIQLSGSSAHFNKGILGYVVSLGGDTAVCNLSGVKKDDAVFKTSTGEINVPLGTAVLASPTAKDIKNSPLAQLLELDGITAVGSDGSNTIYKCPISYSLIAELSPQIRAGMSPQADPALAKAVNSFWKQAAINEAVGIETDPDLKPSSTNQSAFLNSKGNPGQVIEDNSSSIPDLHQPAADARASGKKNLNPRQEFVPRADSKQAIINKDKSSSTDTSDKTADKETLDDLKGLGFLAQDVASFKDQGISVQKLAWLAEAGYKPSDLSALIPRGLTTSKLLALHHDGYTAQQLLSLQQTGYKNILAALKAAAAPVQTAPVQTAPTLALSLKNVPAPGGPSVEAPVFKSLPGGPVPAGGITTSPVAPTPVATTPNNASPSGAPPIQTAPKLARSLSSIPGAKANPTQLFNSATNLVNQAQGEIISQNLSGAVQLLTQAAADFMASGNPSNAGTYYLQAAQYSATTNPGAAKLAYQNAGAAFTAAGQTSAAADAYQSANAIIVTGPNASKPISITPQSETPIPVSIGPKGAPSGAVLTNAPVQATPVSTPSGAGSQANAPTSAAPTGYFTIPGASASPAVQKASVAYLVQNGFTAKELEKYQPEAIVQIAVLVQGNYSAKDIKALTSDGLSLAKITQLQQAGYAGNKLVTMKNEAILQALQALKDTGELQKGSGGYTAQTIKTLGLAGFTPQELVKLQPSFTAGELSSLVSNGTFTKGQLVTLGSAGLTYGEWMLLQPGGTTVQQLMNLQQSGLRGQQLVGNAFAQDAINAPANSKLQIQYWSYAVTALGSTKQGLSSIPNAQFSQIPGWVIASLTPQEFSTISAQQFGAMTGKQAAYISPQQVAVMTTAQIAGFTNISSLSLQSCAAVSTTQLQAVPNSVAKTAVQNSAQQFAGDAQTGALPATGGTPVISPSFTTWQKNVLAIAPSTNENFKSFQNSFDYGGNNNAGNIGGGSQSIKAPGATNNSFKSFQNSFDYGGGNNNANKPVGENGGSQNGGDNGGRSGSDESFKSAKSPPDNNGDIGSRSGSNESFKSAKSPPDNNGDIGGDNLSRSDTNDSFKSFQDSFDNGGNNNANKPVGENGGNNDGDIGSRSGTNESFKSFQNWSDNRGNNYANQPGEENGGNNDGDIDSRSGTNDSFKSFQDSFDYGGNNNANKPVGENGGNNIANQPDGEPGGNNIANQPGGENGGNNNADKPAGDNGGRSGSNDSFKRPPRSLDNGGNNKPNKPDKPVDDPDNAAFRRAQSPPNEQGGNDVAPEGPNAPARGFRSIMDDVDDHIPVLQPGSNFPGAPASTNVPLSAKPDFWSGEGDTDPDAELNPEEDPTPVDFLAKELNPWATPNPSQPVGNGMPSMGKGGMFGFLPTNAYFIPVPTPTYAASFKVGGVKVNPGLGMQMPSGNIQTGTGAGTGMYYVGVPQSVTNYNQGVKTLWGAYGHCLYYANIVTSTKNQIAKQQDGLNKAQTQLSKAQGEEQKISALLQQYTKFTPQQIQQGSGEARQLIANEQSLQTKISKLQNECANHQTNISLLQTKEKNAATQGQNFQIKEISQLANVMKLFVELPTQPWSVFSPTPPQ